MFGLQALGLASMAQSLPKLQAPVAAASGGPGAAQPGLRVRCPFDFGEEAAGSGPGPHGLGRVTRHPGIPRGPTTPGPGTVDSQVHAPARPPSLPVGAGFWSLGAVCLGAAVAVAFHGEDEAPPTGQPQHLRRLAAAGRATG